MIRRPPRSTQSRSSAASDVYKRQAQHLRDLSHPVAPPPAHREVSGTSASTLARTGHGGLWIETEAFVEVSLARTPVTPDAFEEDVDELALELRLSAIGVAIVPTNEAVAEVGVRTRITVVVELLQPQREQVVVREERLCVHVARRLQSFGCHSGLGRGRSS